MLRTKGQLTNIRPRQMIQVPTTCLMFSFPSTGLLQYTEYFLQPQPNLSKRSKVFYLSLETYLVLADLQQMEQHDHPVEDGSSTRHPSHRVGRSQFLLGTFGTNFPGDVNHTARDKHTAATSTSDYLLQPLPALSSICLLCFF